MRIPGRKIWRAFSELDEFSDEQCRRFVKRAWGGWVRRAMALVLVILTFVGTFVAAAYMMVWVHRSLDLDNRKSYSDLQIALTTAIVVVVVCAAAPLMALLARDFLLRALIWRVLNVGGVCSQCSYPLYGLAVSETMACSCPECGAITNVDSALVELVRAENGQTVAQRKSGGRDAKYFWTPRRLKIAGRVCVTSFVVLFVVPAVALALNELIVRIEAARAASRQTSVEMLARAIGRPTVQAEFELRPQPTGTWKIDAELQKLYNRVSRETAEKQNLDQAIVSTDSPFEWNYVARAKPPGTDATQPEREKYEADLQRDRWRRDVLRAMEGSELHEGMRAIGMAEPLLEPVPIVAAPYGAHVLPEFLWGQGFTGKLAIERLRVAAEEGNREKFDESLRAAIGAIRIDVSMPLSSRWWAGMYREGFLWFALREAIGLRPDWVLGVRAIVEAMPIEGDAVMMFEVERLVERDRLLNILSNPDMVRFNRFTPELVRLVGGGGPLPPGRIGWVSENIEMNDRLFDAVKSQLEAPPWNRPPVPALKSDLLLVPVLGMSRNLFQASIDWGQVNRAGMRVWLAIEEYRMKHGRLPDRLQELELPRKTLIDPLSGQSWVYVQTVDEKTRKTLRLAGDYLLYSVSIDGVDDFGRTGDLTIFVSGGLGWRLPALSGRDVLINAELK